MAAIVKLSAVRSKPDEVAAVFDAVHAYLTRYVAFVFPEQADAVALWCVYTHCFAIGQEYRVVPYLLVTSAEPMSGKTTLLDLVRRIVFSPWDPGSASAAAIGRYVSGHTLLVDEIDAIYRPNTTDLRGEDLRGVLNTGFQKGGSYDKLVPDKRGKYVLQTWSVFGPKMLVGIGGGVPETVQSRSIRIRLSRRARGDAPIAKVRDREASAIADPLHARIAKIATSLGILEFADAPDELNGRDSDLWEPLFALADAAGSGWGDRIRRAAIKLCANEQVVTTGVMLLRDIRKLFDATGKPFMTTAEIIGRPENPDPNWGNDASGLCALEGAPWADFRGGKPITSAMVGRMLRRYDIASGDRLRAGGDRNNARGYLRSSFEVAWSKYVTELADDEM